MNSLFINKVLFDWKKVEQGSYLHKINAIKGISEIEFSRPITFFVGENGSGKSTLLEAIAIAYGFNSEGGTLNYSFSTYDSHSELCNAITLSKGYRRRKWGYFLRAESFYNVATQDIKYSRYGGIQHFYHQKSHGESFLSVIQDNFREDGVYLLDEPEAALSPQRQLSLLIEMDKYAKNGAQFIIVTHSPILLGIPNAEIFSFEAERQLHTITYEETESYQVTKMFMDNREAVLYHLLDD